MRKIFPPQKWFPFFLAALAATHAGIGYAQTSPAVTSTVSNSKMDAELFYLLLLGEMQVNAGSAGAGFGITLDTARKTGDPRLYRRATEIALQMRSADAALQAARAWKAAEPQGRDANLQLLSVLIITGRASETKDLLRQQIVLTPAPERNSTLSQVPQLYARVADKKAAAALIEQALHEFTTQSATAAAAWTAIGRTRLAAADAPGALEAAGKGHLADKSAQEPALLALEMMEPKQSAAEPIVREYLQSKTAAPEIRMGYARALMDAQRMSEAAAQTKRITEQKPEFADAWLLQGILALQDNQTDLADASLKKFIELAQPYPESDAKQRGLTQAYLSLAQIAEKRKDYSLSESWLAKVDNPQALVSTQTRRASMLARQGKMNEARELIRKLPERNNGTGEDGAADKRMKLMAEAQLLREHKLYAQAHELLGQAIASNPKDSELLYDQATLAEKLGRMDEFERLLRQLIAAKPDFHHAYNALGYSLADRSIRLPEAKELILKALTYAPGDPYITDSLAWVEFRMGKHAEAIRLLEGAYKSRADAEIAAHLGEVYWSAGQREKALSIWKEGMLVNNENETLLETLKRLKVKL